MALNLMSLSISSSIVPSPDRHSKSNPNPISQDPNFRVARNSVSTPASKTAVLASSSVSKNRNQKESEFPTELFLESITKTPIKKKKKKKSNNQNAKAGAFTLPEALSFSIHKKQWLKALEFFDILREQPYYQPKEETYMKLIVLLGKSGQPNHAHQLFHAIKEDGCESTELYTALIAAYCQNNLIHEAFMTLDEMKNLPCCQPDVFTYSTLIKAHIDASNFDLVELLYDEMAERSLTPNMFTQNIVLSGYGKAGMIDRMEKMLSSMMESTKLNPDVSTMDTVLSVFNEKGQIDMIEKWYDKFREFGIQPETSTFNILIGGYGRKRMYDKMSYVMRYMRKLRCPWTTETYNSVMEAFSVVGDAENMESAFDQMCAEGIKPDSKTFCFLISGYSKAGIFHKVISSVSLTRKLKIPENTSFYNTIISACAKEEALMEMERFFSYMKDKQIRADETTYSVMIEAYRKEGMNDKVYYLEQEKQMMISDVKNLSA